MPDDRGEAEANSLIDKLFFAGRKDSCENCDVCDNDRIDLCLDCRFKYVTEALTRVRRQAVEDSAKIAERYETEFDLPDGVSRIRGDTARAIALSIRKQGREG